MVRRFVERYASAAKQDYVSNRLHELHISKFATGDEAGEFPALPMTLDEVGRLTLMSHNEYRTDRSKMRHLQEAVVEGKWARNVLLNVAAIELRHNTLIERLEYALQKSEKHIAAHNEGTTVGRNKFRALRWKGINCAGQGRYGHYPSSCNSIVLRHKNIFGNPLRPKRSAYSRDNFCHRCPDLSRLTCHYCGKTDCRCYRCTDPVEMKRVARNELKMVKEAVVIGNSPQYS